LGGEEPEEAAQRRRRARDRARRRSPAAQRPEIARHVVAPHVGRLEPRALEERAEALEVAPVRLERVRREALLHREVVEVEGQVALDEGRSGRLRDRHATCTASGATLPSSRIAPSTAWI